MKIVKSTVQPQVVQYKQKKILVNINIEATSTENEMTGETENGYTYNQLRFERNTNTKNLMSGIIAGVLDTQAQQLRYDNMASVRSYAGFDNEFQEEATKLATWASSCWSKAAEVETDVANGDRDMPTIEELIELLPAL